MNAQITIGARNTPSKPNDKSPMVNTQENKKDNHLPKHGVLSALLDSGAGKEGICHLNNKMLFVLLAFGAREVCIMSLRKPAQEYTAKPKRM